MIEQIAPLLIVAFFVGFLVLERIVPARPLPKVKGWMLKGFVFFFITFTVNAVVPAVVAGFVAPYAPLDLSGLGTLAGALVTFIVAQLVVYWVHRAYHSFPALWRWTHQMHHSAERLDIPGAVYFHPFDIAGQAACGTVAVVLLGVTPEAAALAGVTGLFYALFQHLNVRTPQWLGYVIQRPESHSLHHARGVHAYNYADLPVWDLVFGTFRNPREFEAAQGFWDGASSKVGAMLIGRDVGEPASARESLPPAARDALP